MNNRQREIVKRYENSDMYNLYDAYTSFSKAKAEAWDYCKKLMKAHGGKALKVIGACNTNFSAGFIYEENGVKYLMYITKSYDRAIRLED